MDLTVGYISGFIALAIFVIRFLLPNILSVILVHVLKEEQSAVTWSVASRDLQNSTWPLLLKTDAATSRSVKPAVKVLSIFRSLLLVLITVAAVVTPLGLYGFVEPSDNLRPVDFAYMQDMSNIGIGTRPRPSNFNFFRICGAGIAFTACPGTPDGLTQSLSSHVPSRLFNLYESGLSHQKSTVSSIFDIQWRRYTYTPGFAEDNGKRYPVGTYLQLETHLPSRGIELVEGLIVDYESTGIGFRNHTLPSDSTVDAEWEEDILFIEPETSCVDTNLTLQFSAGRSGFAHDSVDGLQLPFLVDRGGFADFPPAAPYPRYGDTQQDPKLAHRAFNGGWLNNYESMVYMGIVKPSTHPWDFVKATINDVHQLGNYNVPNDLDSIMSTKYNHYLLQFDKNPDFYENPYDIKRINFTYPGLTCSAAGSLDEADINHIGTSCGLVYGSPQPTGEDYAHHGSKWFQPIYSCASTTRAIIKTVHFRYRAESNPSLDSLQVVSIRNKTYGKHSDLPYWGVEKPHLTLGEADPLWGLVDKDIAAKAGDDISVVQSERLYLPGLPFYDAAFDPASNDELGGVMNLPGANFYLSALLRLYHTTSGPYTGSDNFALSRKWKQLSDSPKSTEEMMNLIWTDMSANAVMGTRGWLSAPRTFKDDDEYSVLANRPSRRVPVFLYVSKVGYHWWYSVPAFLMLAVAGLLTLVSVVIMIFGRGRPKHIRYYLNRFSAGRLMVINMGGDIDSSTKKWVDEVGHQKVDISTIGADAEDVGEVSVEANKGA